MTKLRLFSKLSEPCGQHDDRFPQYKILVDHFTGKRSADDPQVKQELQLLKQQAAIDWKEMYSDKPTQATPENIAEDYINNAKLTASTERTLKRIKLIVALAVVLAGVLFYTMKR